MVCSTIFGRVRRPLQSFFFRKHIVKLNESNESFIIQYKTDDLHLDVSTKTFDFRPDGFDSLDYEEGTSRIKQYGGNETEKFTYQQHFTISSVFTKKALKLPTKIPVMVGSCEKQELTAIPESIQKTNLMSTDTRVVLN